MELLQYLQLGENNKLSASTSKSPQGGAPTHLQSSENMGQAAEEHPGVIGEVHAAARNQSDWLGQAKGKWRWGSQIQVQVVQAVAVVVLYNYNRRQDTASEIEEVIRKIQLSGADSLCMSHGELHPALCALPPASQESRIQRCLTASPLSPQHLLRHWSRQSEAVTPSHPPQLGPTHTAAIRTATTPSSTCNRTAPPFCLGIHGQLSLQLRGFQDGPCGLRLDVSSSNHPEAAEDPQGTDDDDGGSEDAGA